MWLSIGLLKDSVSKFPEVEIFIFFFNHYLRTFLFSSLLTYTTHLAGWQAGSCSACKRVVLKACVVLMFTTKASSDLSNLQNKLGGGPEIRADFFLSATSSEQRQQKNF